LRGTFITTSIRGLKPAIEVWQEVDRDAVEFAGREDAWDFDADIWLGI
jgi:hypothetical protein